MSLGSEGPETEFVDGVEQLDEAVRAMTGMLNNRNRGVVIIGVDGRGEPLGISFGEDDVRRVREAVERSLNHLPKFDVSIGSDGGKEYLRIAAEGYEIPYSCDGWFYSRRRCPGSPDGKEWVTLLTCGMRHH